MIVSFSVGKTVVLFSISQAFNANNHVSHQLPSFCSSSFPPSFFVPVSPVFLFFLSVLIYVSYFAERQEQPEGFLLHNTALVTSNAPHCFLDT